MSNKGLSLCVALIVLLVLSSCMERIPYRMEVLRPAGGRIPLSYASVLLLDRSIPQPDEMGHTMKLPEIKEIALTASLDSFPQALLTSMQSRLKQTDYIDRVEMASPVSEYAKNRPEHNFITGRPIQKTQQLELQAKHPVNYWLTLDRVFVQSQLKAQPRGYSSYALRTAVVQTIWSVLDGTDLETAASFQQFDTLYWEAVSALSHKESMQQIVPLEDALPEMADMITERAVRYLVPYWEEVLRYYHVDGNYRFKLAHDCIRNDQWDSAADLWKETYKKARKSGAYRAALNMVLYYEKLDQPVDALTWLDRASEKLMEKHDTQALKNEQAFIEHYRQYLEKRQIEKTQIP